MKNLLLLLSFIIITSVSSVCFAGQKVTGDLQVTGLTSCETIKTDGIGNVSCNSANAIDISDETNLAVTSPITLTGDTLSLTLAEDSVLVGTPATAKLLPSCSNGTTSKLLYNNSTNAFSCGTDQTGAPTNATYITQTANGTLTAEQALSSLSSGIMRVATTTGVITSLTTSSGIATNISDETGTGSLAFNNNTTFTGIQRFADGSPSAPSITYSNDATTGLFLEASGIFGVASAGNRSLRLSSSTLYLGDRTAPVGDIYFGYGINDATGDTGLNSTLHASGVSGKDKTANDLVLAGGVSTGVGAQRKVIIKTTQDLASGSGNQELQTVRIYQGGATHFYSNNAESPTVESCGDGATVNGTDSEGYITIGTSASSECTLIFTDTWNELEGNPICVAVFVDFADFIYLSHWGPESVRFISGLGSDISSTQIHYICRGWQNT